MSLLRRPKGGYGLDKKYTHPLKRPQVIDRSSDFDWFSILSLSRSVLTIRISVSIRLLYTSHFNHLYWALAGLALAGCCYGGLHLTAWTCRFPSRSETILWRASSVTILAAGPAIIIVVLHIIVLSTSTTAMENWLTRRGLYSHKWVINMYRFQTAEIFARVTLFYIWSIWYIFCRAFIVVECFVMLAHVPDTTLEVPGWAAYVPHIA
jgi:hypothetical protein